MPRLKVLSGEDVIRILESFNFIVVAQKGSHVKLRRKAGQVSLKLLLFPITKN